MMMMLAIPPGHLEGGGSGGGRGTGGTLKKGREERNSAVGPGLNQRSRVVRVVGWEGHENR